MAEVYVDLVAVQEFQMKNDWNDAALALAMGVSRTLISRVKTGKRKPGAAFIKGLLRAGMPSNKIFSNQY